MEDTLREPLNKCISNMKTNVLILILMEDTLRELWHKRQLANSEKS